jgi:ATP-dependent protease ClpP protease subunit
LPLNSGSRPSGLLPLFAFMDEENTLQLYGEIGPAWAGMIDDTSVIRALDSLKDAKKIHVRLNSPGGDYFLGVSISNALRRHNAKIIVHVDALAASAASVIAMGGDRVIMHPGALMMIHRAWSITMGNSADFAKAAETLNKVDENLIDVYHKRTGMDKSKLRTLVDAETWMSGDEAVSYGFADEANTQPTGATAKVPQGWYARTPDKVGQYALSIAASARKPVVVPTKSNPSDAYRQARFEALKRTTPGL